MDGKIPQTLSSALEKTDMIFSLHFYQHQRAKRILDKAIHSPSKKLSFATYRDRLEAVFQ